MALGQIEDVLDAADFQATARFAVHPTSKSSVKGVIETILV
jgi:hypothetical protein